MAFCWESWYNRSSAVLQTTGSLGRVFCLSHLAPLSGEAGWDRCYSYWNWSPAESTNVCEDVVFTTRASSKCSHNMGPNWKVNHGNSSKQWWLIGKMAWAKTPGMAAPKNQHALNDDEILLLWHLGWLVTRFFWQFVATCETSLPTLGHSWPDVSDVLCNQRLWFPSIAPISYIYIMPVFWW